MVKVLGFSLPQYKAPTLLLSLGLSVRVLWYLIVSRPDVIHASSPGVSRCPMHVPPSSVIGKGVRAISMRYVLRSCCKLDPSERACLPVKWPSMPHCGHSVSPQFVQMVHASPHHKNM